MSLLVPLKKNTNHELTDIKTRMCYCHHFASVVCPKTFISKTLSSTPSKSYAKCDS